MFLTRTRAVGGLILALAASGFYTQPATANPGGTGLVISEVYGGGGNTGAPYTNDFIELYNPTGATISVAGMSVQYRSATGTSAQVTTLSGSVPAGGHYLVQEAAGSTASAALPTPDASGNIAMSSSGGVVLLVPNTTAFTATGNLAGNAGLLDMVGYGTTPTSFETVNTGVALTNTTAATRTSTGADSDHNANDFSEVAPAPQNSAAGPVDPPPPGTVDKTIAEIQGTGDTSPFAGQNVHTTGVVTAAYPTGGFNGFYLQTPGTGDATDETPGASDAVFVFGSAATAKVARGDYVDVTGAVSEFFGTTEITPAAAADVTVRNEQAAAPLALATTLPPTNAAKEAHEGELLAPSGPFTVTNTFTTHQFGEIGLASGTTPLIAPTEVADAQDTAAIASVTADNAARAIALDDGASINFLSAANTGIPVPWLSRSNPIRVGARATLASPVVLEFRNNIWKFQPTSPVTGEGQDTATFANTRTPAPEAVGGDLRIATFNVLNCFPTTGAEYAASGLGSCTYYTDRSGAPITVNTCANNGPRGAANVENLTRQQDKIVAAINKLGASIVSLEEIENSVKFGKNRDSAVSILVNALNTAAGSDMWAFAPSPAPEDRPTPAQEDVIRTAFIYRPADVTLVGASKILIDETNFANAREPLAQAFKRTGTRDTDAFAVIVNHFKSKGSGVDDGTGQGKANPDRINQAHALSAFADSFKAERGLTKVFLTGDFNAYSKEDPIQVLEADGYTAIDSTTANEETYSFSGLSGSLDHVFANEAAKTMVTGADVWNINSGESLAFEYSRYNFNVSEFYEANQFRASDHDPEIVGIDVAEPLSPTVELNLLGTNDFHGRINANTVKWAGTVEELTAGKEANTLFVGSGDLIGASEFASAVQDDQPTIDVLNALGLDASAVGNHEFDKGFADLTGRVIGAAGSRNAMWDYLGANVYKRGTTEPALPEYALFDVDGIQIAVVGAVTEETRSLVSPGGITEIEFGNPVDAVNRVAGRLSDDSLANGEADVIVATFHAGAQQGVTATPPSSYAAELAKGGEFSQMANLDASVDAIFNGHTHQVYAWDAPVPGSATRTRPIVQTGEYGSNVGQVTLTIDRATGDVTSYQAKNVARTTTSDSTLTAAYPRVGEVKRIVDAALAHAAEVGNQPVGSITGDITRALGGGSYVNGTYAGGTTEDRGSESTLGDLVANSLRDGLPADITADLGIVNPGGLRADLRYLGNTSSNPANTDGVVTYAEANSVLPFVNNVWTVDLTGAQLKAVLEQQWQPVGASRPFLALGLSDNLRVTQDANKPRGSRITSVAVNGEPLDLARTYTVSTFSFLGTGGDNFTAFKEGTSKDTGLVDRDLWIGYLQSHSRIAPDFARQQVTEAGKPEQVKAGQRVEFALSKLNLTSLGSPENTTVTMTAVPPGNATPADLGSVPVTSGTAAIAFTVPAAADGGEIRLTAQPSGTTVTIPIADRTPTGLTATASPMTYGSAGSVDVTITSTHPLTGTIEVLDGTRSLGTATVGNDGTASVTIPGTALEPGSHQLTVSYSGDQDNEASTGSVDVVVSKATPTVSSSMSSTQVQVKSGTTTAGVTVRAPGYQPDGVVEFYLDGVKSGERVLTDGTASFTFGPFEKVGSHTVTMRYLGDTHTTAGSSSSTFEVVKKPKK